MAENRRTRAQTGRPVARSESFGDFWKPVAHRFAPPKKGESGPDDTVDRLVEITSPYDTVLDVGACGGRLAMPIADHVSHVTGVEPSDSMRERLTTAANAWGANECFGDRRSMGGHCS